MRFRLAAIVWFVGACSGANPTGRAPTREDDVSVADNDPTARARQEMVERDIAARGIGDERVLAAMREVPRHRFVLPELVAYAYEDRPLPIGHRQTISQPYIVAFMTEAVRPRATDRALDVGTGSGYQAAVLSRLARYVYSVERYRSLLTEAEQKLKVLGVDNVITRHGDGGLGWPE